MRRPPARWLAALLPGLIAATSGCDLGDLADDDAAVIPPDHPCADRALAPRASRLWASHDASGEPVPFALVAPLAPGAMATISQGPDQAPTHHGASRWAWDLAVPYGTAVHAAASGVVVWVRDDSRRHGDRPAYAADANVIVVDHGGGLFTSYTHLARDSALVAAGDRVAAGEALATTGASGQLTGPHLHFQLENTWSQSLPARFVDPTAGGCDLAPQLGDTVTADAGQVALMVGRDEASALPTDTFAASGVSTVSGLPARLLERDRTYRVSGRAAGRDEVYLIIAPPKGGDAVAFWRFAVAADGAFAGDVRLAAIPAGRYGIALVAVPTGTAVVAAATVRASLVD